MSVSIPHAFGERGAYFAGAYAFMQVGRTIFFLWAVRGGPATLTQNFRRILVWLSTSGACWLAGGFAAGGSRYGWWVLALTIEFLGPWLYFAVPGLGRSSTSDWKVHGGHMAVAAGASRRALAGLLTDQSLQVVDGLLCHEMLLLCRV